MVYRHSSAADYADMIVDNFDEMLRKSQDTPLVYVISLHSFIMGQPFRLARLRRALQHILGFRGQTWFTLPGEIARYYQTLPSELQLRAD